MEEPPSHSIKDIGNFALTLSPNSHQTFDTAPFMFAPADIMSLVCFQ